MRAATSVLARRRQPAGLNPEYVCLQHGERLRILINRPHCQRRTGDCVFGGFGRVGGIGQRGAGDREHHVAVLAHGEIVHERAGGQQVGDLANAAVVRDLHGNNAEAFQREDAFGREAAARQDQRIVAAPGEVGGQELEARLHLVDWDRRGVVCIQRQHEDAVRRLDEAGGEAFQR